MLIGMNIPFQLGVIELDLALVLEKSITIIETCLNANKSFFKAWEWFNRVCLNLMRMTMAENIKSSMPKVYNTKEFVVKSKEHS